MVLWSCCLTLLIDAKLQHLLACLQSCMVPSLKQGHSQLAVISLEASMPAAGKYRKNSTLVIFEANFTPRMCLCFYTATAGSLAFHLKHRRNNNHYLKGRLFVCSPHFESAFKYLKRHRTLKAAFTWADLLCCQWLIPSFVTHFLCVYSGGNQFVK